MSEDQRKYRNKATKLTQMDPKNIGYFSWNTMYCNVQSLFNWMFSLRERETLQQQVRANTERRRQSSRTWIVPEFHQLAIVTPHNPRVIILMSKSKLGVFIYLCLWLLELPDDSGILHGTLQNIHLFADLWQHWDKTIEWNDNEKYYIYFHESYGNRCLKMVAKPLDH